MPKRMAQHASNGKTIATEREPRCRRTGGEAAPCKLQGESLKIIEI